MRSIHLKLKNMIDGFFAEFGVTGVQAMVLGELYLNENLKITDLAKELNMTNSNLSAICRRLENNGMLQRKRDTNDQRIVKITLTDKAHQMADRMVQTMREEYFPLYQTATKEDREDIVRGLTKLDKLLSIQPNDQAHS
ncbi:MarR family winged helix-turn-helix transcriptional regulator [Zongyangia hominis]|uniref:MarR family transcriptional regulator n=1 Tax=Zongyangia hominis TaxID=2763677 RepID=A0A926I606_9FIRM|nr:MarR family transcriptional regulator [Zongyangia hominis]MBC8569489.1 MarR family transcriptional regulator [Zongyangia hominis]